jgi:hypothetical protein
MGCTLSRNQCKYCLHIHLVFLAINSKIGYSLTLSLQALFKFTRTANVSAYLWVLASGVIANFVVANLVNNENTEPGALFGIQLIPPFALFRGLNDLAEYAFQANYQGIYGMKWSNINDPRNGIADCYAILFVEGVLFLLAAAYLQVTILFVGVVATR